MSWVYVNGGFVRAEEASISVFDHGFLYGDGVYETLRAYHGRIFLLDEHLARLRRSAGLIGMELPFAEAEWRALLHQTLRRNELAEAYVRVTVSRGAGDIGLDPGLCPTPTVVILAKSFSPYPTRLYQEGVALGIVQVRRNSPLALSPQIKSLNFLNNILAKQEAARAGRFDGIMLNASGDLTECATSNIGMVRDGEVHTPSVGCGILDGLTRDLVLLLAKEHGIPVHEGRYRPEFLFAAAECFLTNTTMEVMPVREVNDCTIGAGKPGPVTQRLQSLFQTKIQEFIMKTHKSP